MKIALPLRNIVSRRIFLLLELDTLASITVIPNEAPKLIPKALKIEKPCPNLLKYKSKPHNNIPPIRDDKITNVHSAPSNDLKYELHWKSL